MSDTDSHGDFASFGWTEPEHEMKLVNGVWKQVVDHTPPSSSRRTEVRKPRSIREKKEWEAAEKAAAEAESAESAEGEVESAEPDSPDAEGSETPAAEPAT